MDSMSSCCGEGVAKSHVEALVAWQQWLVSWWGWVVMIGVVGLGYLYMVGRGRAYSGLQRTFGGPPRHVLLGHNLLEMSGGEEVILAKMREWRMRYGSVFLVWYTSTTPTLIVADAAFAKRILNSQVDVNYYAKGYEHEFKPWLGNSILLAHGDAWRTKRRMIMPAFHGSKQAAFLPVFVSCAQRLISRWSSALDSDQNSFIDLDIPSELKVCSLDIVASAAFGYTQGDSGTQQNVHTDIVQHFQLVLSEIEKRSYHFITLPNWFYCKFTTAGKRFSRSVRHLQDYVYDIIHTRRAALDKSDGSPNLLDLLMSAVDEEGNHLSDEQIQEDMQTFLFAGHETTSILLSWTLYLLSTHIVVEDRLLGEIYGILGKKAHAKIPSEEQLNQMEFLNAVLQESLRLYPPQPAFVRRALQDHTIGGYLIPKDTEVSIVPYLIHRDEQYHSKPDEFMPERFCGRDNSSRTHAFAFIPFSGGQRSCIGKYFAMAEARAVLCMLITRFKFTLPNGATVYPVPEVTLRPMGLTMRIERRQPA